MKAFDDARVGDVADDLLLAERPGAACLFLAIQSLIIGNFVPDEDLHRLGRSLASASLQKITDRRTP